MILNPNSSVGAAVAAETVSVTAAALQGVIAESYDTLLVSNVGTVFTSGVIYLAKLAVPATSTVSSILYTVGTAGATLTAGQNLLGLYDAGGKLLGASADQSTNFAATANLAAAKTAALTAPVTVPAGVYYAATLSVGATPVAFGRTTTTGPASANLSAALGWRHGSVLTGQTSLPASITMAAVAWANIPYWIAIA